MASPSSSRQSSRQLHSPVTPGTLRDNVAWSFVGNVVFAACQWLMIVALAQLGNATVVGEFALALAVTTPVMMLANMQLRWVQATDDAATIDIRDCLALRLVCVLGGLITIGLITFVSGYDTETCLVIWTVALAKSFESISDVLHGWFQQHERMEFISQSLMFRGVVSVVVVGGIFALTGRLSLACGALAASWLGVLLLFDLPHTRQFARTQALRPFGVRWDWQQVATIFSRALPVGLTAGIVALQANIPRYFIEHSLGREQLGVFAAMASLLLAAETFVRAVNQSAMPQMARFLRTRQPSRFCSVVRKLAGLGALCGIVSVIAALLTAKWVLQLAYGEEFARDPHLLTWMIVAAGLSFVLRPAEVAVRAMRRFWWLFVVHGLGLPLFVAATAIGVATYGMWGAAHAMVAQCLWHGIVVLGLYGWLARRMLQEDDAPHATPLEFGAHRLRGPHFISRRKSHHPTATHGPTNATLQK